MRRGTRNTGFTLVELMIVVAIIGILASIAIPALSRTVKKARTAETAGHLNKMWTGALSYYEADHSTAAGVAVSKRFPAMGTTTTQEASCCSGPARRCPGNASVYQTNVNWVALHFNIPDRHYYRPVFSSAGTGVAATFVATATGDLDCDGRLATFTRRGRVVGGDVVGTGTPYVVREVE